MKTSISQLTRFAITLGLYTSAILIVPASSYGMQTIAFGPQETQINGSIKYTVIGKYRANFERFKGEIAFDRQTGQITSVQLVIEAETITSNCDWCDKIVRSEQLLHTEKHPYIIFKSSEIIKDNNGYRVKGTLEMHGVKKEAVFPFEAEIAEGGEARGRVLTVSGKWLINRKDFDIVWNKILDKGGILVGNDITVDWGIQSPIREQEGSET